MARRSRIPGLGDDGSVGVYIEAPVYGGFKSAHCRIPALIWDIIKGCSTKEMRDLDELVRNNAPLILRMAKEDAEEEKVRPRRTRFCRPLLP